MPVPVSSEVRPCTLIRQPSPGFDLTARLIARAAILGNPLFLVKARMQAYSPFHPVGAQHHYTSALHGLIDIVRKEGVKGLARGVDAAVLRTAMGSSVQLPAYNLAKTTFSGWGVGDHAGLYLLSSTFSGLCVCTVMQPAGASTRLHRESVGVQATDLMSESPQIRSSLGCTTKRRTRSARTESRAVSSVRSILSPFLHDQLVAFSLDWECVC